MAGGLLLTACGSSEPASSDSGWEKVSDGSTEDAATEAAADETDAASVSAEDVAIEETVLYEENDIKITATGFDADALFGPELQLLIENNSAQNYVFQTDYAVVNGYMITDLLSADVAAGKKSTESLTFMTATLERCGVSTITDIRMDIKVINPDTYQTLFTTGEITITTSAAGSYSQTYDDSGVEIYNTNGIRIVAQQVTDDFLGKSALFYIENNSSYHIGVSGDDVSVNGFMMTDLMYSDVVPGAHDVTELTLLSSELEENGIEDITELELSLRISDTDTYQTIDETGAITLTMNK